MGRTLKKDYTPMDNKTIRRGDILKYIGPATSRSGGGYRRVYSLFKRRPLIVYHIRYKGATMEVCFANVDPNEGWGEDYWMSLKQGNWTLIGHKDFDAQKHKRATKNVSKAIKGFSKNYESLLKLLKKRVDHQLDSLQLHHKMDILRNLSKEEKATLDIIYGDADESFKKLIKEEQIEEVKVS